MLNWPALAAVGELLGALGVVASLVYVGQQVKQNTVRPTFMPCTGIWMPTPGQGFGS